ncbi:MAG: FN3 associated domain-containing protein [Cyclobacteriaceae bacterium]
MPKSIYYTVDNTKPDLNSEIYADPIPLNSVCDTIKAIAAIDNITSDSVSSFKYWEEWPFPPVALFSELAGVFNNDQEISMQVANVATSNLNSPGYYPPPPCVRIYYTVDGSVPTINSTQYIEPFSVEGNGTLFRIRAITAGHPFIEPSIVVENIIRIDYSSDPANYDKNLSLDDYNLSTVNKNADLGMAT